MLRTGYAGRLALCAYEETVKALGLLVDRPAGCLSKALLHCNDMIMCSVNLYLMVVK